MVDTFTYHGKNVIINRPGESRSHDEHMTHDTHDTLSINDADIHVMTLKDGKFATHYFPYSSFDSLEEMAKDLIDKVPEFGPHLIKREGENK